MTRGGWVDDLVEEELLTVEAGVTLPAVGVEDPECRPAPRWAVAIPGDQCLGALADDVAPEADPRAPGQLQAEAGRFGDGPGQASGETGRFQDDEQRLCSPGQGGKTTEPIGDDRGTIRGRQPAAGQVQDQEIHRTAGEQRAADGEALIERLGRDDHEPFEANPAGDGLDRIEAPGEIQPGHDGARGLGLRGKPQDECGPAAGAVTANGDTRRARQPAGSQDRVERGKPGRDDPLVRVWLRLSPRRLFRRQAWSSGQSQGPIRGSFGDPRSCRSPSSLEARHGCRHVRGECRHPSKIEHLFYRIKYDPLAAAGLRHRHACVTSAA
jgi:hypothetical protein